MAARVLSPASATSRAEREQLMPHRHEMLGNDMKPGVRHEMVDVRHTARHRILNWDHPEIGLPHTDGGERIFERRARHRLEFGIDLTCGQVGIGSGLTLEDDLVACGHGYSRMQSAHREREAHDVGELRILRARSRSSGVSTPSGTVSTIETSIRMPASSARNCSSFSRFSSVDGESSTNWRSASRR